MRKISKKVRITTLISLMLVLGGISLFLFMVKQNEKAMLNQEKGRAAVVLADNETRVLFFYKDTCADCQKVYPTVYEEDQGENNIVFINLNQPKNRHYIKTYTLEKVPTFVTPKRRYVGTDTRKIQQLIAENNDERSED
ncbi:thioredoxin domain-containing protein [Enterococcus faecalis]|uniref:thioredoxin domain-containing protein n=1 Tax=Enterococcus faecalis TaxID=1351 RepID=UPI00164F1EDA|nr:thioredoxin domain-containing protein [Enterococcus faecalis]MBW7793643.1 hypothetical protein [Enterococcus faecalis]